MKKIVLVIFLALGVHQFSNAQINFGIKAGINYNNNGWPMTLMASHGFDSAPCKNDVVLGGLICK